jgi:hypothetical protein
VNVEAPADGVKTVFRGHENIIKPQIARISPIRSRSPIPVQETRQLFFRTHNVTLSVALSVNKQGSSRPLHAPDSAAFLLYPATTK